MFPEEVWIDGLMGQILHVDVMCEKENLTFFGKFRKDLQGGLGPLIVEIDQKIVGHERNGFE